LTCIIWRLRCLIANLKYVIASEAKQSSRLLPLDCITTAWFAMTANLSHGARIDPVYQALLMKEYPWLKSVWQQLENTKAEKRLAHAMFFSGLPGLGKRELATQFAHGMLCEAGDGLKACGQCQNCNLLRAGTHPDLIRIEPEEGSRSIKIAQIRDLIATAYQTPQIASMKVIVIHPVDKMNTAAMNALLKTLEEPVTNTYLVLLSDNMSKVLPTIRSRCVLYQLKAPETSLAFDFLKQQLPDRDDHAALLSMAFGAPLKAIELAQSDLLQLREKWFQSLSGLLNRKNTIIQCAEPWVKSDTAALLSYLYVWLADVWRLKLGLDDTTMNTDLLPTLKTWSTRLNTKKLPTYLDKLQNDIALIKGPVSLNAQLLLETTLLDLMRLTR
jgi:DNA polymerase III subunit delta'